MLWSSWNVLVIEDIIYKSLSLSSSSQSPWIQQWLISEKCNTQSGNIVHCSRSLAYAAYVWYPHSCSAEINKLITIKARVADSGPVITTGWQCRQRLMYSIYPHQPGTNKLDITQAALPQSMQSYAEWWVGTGVYVVYHWHTCATPLHASPAVQMLINYRLWDQMKTSLLSHSHIEYFVYRDQALKSSLISIETCSHHNYWNDCANYTVRS